MANSRKNAEDDQEFLEEECDSCGQPESRCVCDEEDDSDFV